MPCRVLNPPQIGYKKHVDGKTIPAKIEMGKWNMPQSSNFVRGMELKTWGVLCLARVDDRTWGAFEGALIQDSAGSTPIPKDSLAVPIVLTFEVHSSPLVRSTDIRSFCMYGQVLDGPNLRFLY